MPAGEANAMVEIVNGIDGAGAARGVTVIIDVFRAFTTACHIAQAMPRRYLLAGESSAVMALIEPGDDALLVGKAERGARLAYDVPNSPTLVDAQPIAGRTVIHRTDAGARGILAARYAQEVLTGTFSNASAVVRYVTARRPEHVTLVAMGTGGGAPAPEDQLCARLIAHRLAGEEALSLLDFEALRESSGRYFFTGAAEYPAADFDACTKLDAFDFVLLAECHPGHARLRRVDV